MAKKRQAEEVEKPIEDVSLEVPEVPQIPEVEEEKPKNIRHDDDIHSHVDEDHAAEEPEEHGGVDQERVIRLIESIENDLRALRQLLSGTMPARVDHASRIASAPVGFMQHGEDAGIDGIFDGERMVDAEGKGYQVPPNYASKSKLVEGDPLKLYITGDGKYVYKQLGPVDRTTVPGTLRLEGNHYVVDADDGKTYNILTACVTYYMSLYGLEPDGRIMAMIPTTENARWAVIDNVL